MLKFFVFAPDDEAVIKQIIDAAAEAGAGKIGNYSHCSFVTKGHGMWKSLEGANPHIGQVGEFSKEPEVKIEMECTEQQMPAVKAAIEKVHPYETVVIDAIEIKRYE